MWLWYRRLCKQSLIRDRLIGHRTFERLFRCRERVKGQCGGVGVSRNDVDKDNVAVSVCGKCR